MWSCYAIIILAIPKDLMHFNIGFSVLVFKPGGYINIFQ